jgi:TetR/AcrR family transcriptional regulator, regulator of cefoperazone and chloramphenicol sensitivity
MATPLEKARKDPDSMKARILKTARRVFGEYGFHGATTRMIAEEVGVDISTLYYHWGEKSDLYQAVIMDINEDLRQTLIHVEHCIRGKPLDQRLRIAIHMTMDYLFENPETSNLVLFRYFAKTRDESIVDMSVPEFIFDIGRSMGLCQDKNHVPNDVRMKILAMMNTIHNFVSGEDFFRGMLNVTRDEYIALAKQTVEFILIPAFAGQGGRAEE